MRLTSRFTLQPAPRLLAAWAKLAFLPWPHPWPMLSSLPPENEFAGCRSIQPLWLRVQGCPHDAQCSNLCVRRFCVSLAISYSQSFASSFPQASTQASSDQGTAIFRKSCSVCHGIRPGETKVGDFYEKVSVHSEQAVRETIADGKGTMPAF